MMEFFIQFLVEVLLQIVFEVLAELGLRSLVAPFRKPPEPWLATLGYVLFGLVAGALSLWMFPELFIQTPTMQLVGLILIPIAAGTAMAALGAWRRRRDQALIRLDRFVYGYVFALAMALVRAGFGK